MYFPLFSVYFWSENLATWSFNEVIEWIQSLGEDYRVYTNIFKQDNVDGYCLYRCINDIILSRYGITNQEHQRKILSGIAELKQIQANRRGSHRNIR